MRSAQPILLVENSDDDVELTLRAFRDAKIENPVVRAADGVEALDYLFAHGAQLPALVLLDLNMPRLDGIAVLKAVRADERTRHLPVVMLSSSVEDVDRIAAYRERANSYVRKPVSYDELVMIAKQLGLYWLALNVPARRKI